MCLSNVTQPAQSKFKNHTRLHSYIAGHCFVSRNIRQQSVPALEMLSHQLRICPFNAEARMGSMGALAS